MIEDNIREYKDSLKLSEKEENTINQYEGYFKRVYRICKYKK